MPAAWKSGMLGATASCMVKWAFQTSIVYSTLWMPQVCSIKHDTRTRETSLFALLEQFAVSLPVYCLVIEVAVRLAGLLGMIFCNSLMLAYMLEGMQESGSLAGTGLSTAANFITSAILGYLFWSEQFYATWIVGFILVLLGAYLLTSVQVREGMDSVKSKEEKRD
jgi:drug/metabolite transporter (DMT)-like permease